MLSGASAKACNTQTVVSIKTQEMDAVFTGLIVFGEDWGVHPSSTQHLIRRIAEQRPVVWVDSIGLRQPRFSLRDVKRVWKKIFYTRKNRVDEPLPELTGNRHLHPRTLPAPRSRIARTLAASLLKNQLQASRKEVEFNRPVLWTSLPTAVDMVGKLDEAAVIYYVGDDFTALAGVDHDTIAKRELELAGKADLIIAASPVIARRFPSDKTRVLLHGVDYELFATDVAPADELDERPTAGFYGSISEWLDIDLMVETARRMPHWRFVFIGNIETDVSALKAEPNIELLGRKPHHELPRWSQHWQVSLLPFKDNEQIRASNPLKLREYMAAGSAVITTNFPALDGFRDLVNVVSNADEMQAQLTISLLDVRKDVRRHRVAGETWDAQAEKLSGWISTMLESAHD